MTCAKDDGFWGTLKGKKMAKDVIKGSFSFPRRKCLRTDKIIFSFNLYIIHKKKQTRYNVINL